MSADVLKLLIEATVASSLAVAIVMILRVPMRKMFGARVAYTLWCLVPLALIAVSIPAQKIVVKAVSQAVIVETNSASIVSSMPVLAVDYSSDIFLLLWLAGIIACVFWFARQQQKYIGSLGILNPCYEKVFLAENNNQGPSLIGVMQPRIVLPSDFNLRYSPEEQNLVLTHEQIHLSRGDTRINLLATLLQCVFWYNPLLHWAGGRFRFDQELSADANVLSKFPLSRKPYADAMLKTQMASIGLPITCHWQAHHPLKERILMLKKSTPRKMYRVLGFGLVTVLCLGGAFAAWSTQPANIIAVQADAGLQYEIRIDTKIDHVDMARIKLREAPGKPFAVSNGNGAQDWSYEFTVMPIDAEYVFLKGKFMLGGVLVSEPAIKLAIGSNGSLAVSPKDDSSVIVMNLVVTEVRNGKSSSIVEYGDARPEGAASSDHFMQSRSGTTKVFTEAELFAQQLQPVEASEIITAAKLLPSEKFQKHVVDGKNAGKKLVRVSVLVDQNGLMAGAKFVDTFQNDSSNVVSQATDLLMKEKYQPAIGKNGKPVPSNITVALYDNFTDSKLNN